MAFLTKEIHFTTAKSFDIIDFTSQVKNFLQEIGAKEGLVNIFTRHTTATLKINEAEDGLWKDLQLWADKNIPIDTWYNHDDLPNRDPATMSPNGDENINGHAHIRAMLLGVSSETIPVTAGVMMLGVRQKILFIEMDHARPRSIILSFTGELV